MFVVRGFLWPDTSWHLFGLRTSWGDGDVALWGPPYVCSPRDISLIVISSVTLQQTNITMENHPFLIGDTFSRGCFSIVILVFLGVVSRVIPIVFEVSYVIQHSWQVTGDKAPHPRSGEWFYCSRSIDSRWVGDFKHWFLLKLIGKMMEELKIYWRNCLSSVTQPSYQSYRDPRFVACLYSIYHCAVWSEFQCLEMLQIGRPWTTSSNVKGMLTARYQLHGMKRSASIFAMDIHGFVFLIFDRSVLFRHVFVWMHCLKQILYADL